MLTVLNVAYPFVPVTPDAVGGAEQILSAVQKAAKHAGHRSLVLGCEGSEADGQLFTVPRADGPFTPARLAEVERRYRAEIERIVEEAAVDVVHMHGVDFHAYLPDAPTPVLATLHLPPEWYPPQIFTEKRPHTYFNCVSHSQRQRCPSSEVLLEDVPNGVDLSRFHPSHEDGGYALVLGRICPEKGTHVALDAAHRADVPLLVAGEVFPFPEHLRYFEKEVRPRLDARRRFIGPVGRRGKRRLLARASCVIVPSVVPETSSLVSMEALASGTPVIAFPNGALPEIVAHGRTGFLVRDFTEMVDAIRKARTLTSEDCRATAERFALDTMCGRYLSIYERIARRAPARIRGSRAVTTIEIDDVARLHALETEWDDLWARSPEATVFQRPQWLLPWCTHLLQGRLRVVAIRRGARLIGTAPFFVWNDGGRRVLSLLGAGVSDYADMLVDPEERDAVMRALGDWLDTAGGWDRGLWSELPSGSPLLELTRGRGVTADEQDVCPGLELTGHHSLRDALSSRKWASIRLARSRAERHGGVHFTEATAGTFGALFSRLVELHTARWREHGGGMLADPRVRAFHLDAGPRLMAQGALTLSGVHIGGTLAGVLYTFHDRRASRCYLSGFDAALGDASPGTLAFAHALECAIARGDACLDFLRGGESYKYSWGALDRRRVHRATWDRPCGSNQWPG
ncbi:GNAT family N-acetyltransferase [Pendulispora brunnea]|uniref:GNAT family N-acetyltransferase n=1 Tax=Pendulispora brunnea TaxID=2905690 RepID=A0ABZ2JW48_9BACT